MPEAASYVGAQVAQSAKNAGEYVRQGSSSASDSVTRGASRAGGYVTQGVQEYPLSALLSAAVVSGVLGYLLRARSE